MKVPRFIWYAGHRMQYVRDYNDIDIAQRMIDLEKRAEGVGCCTHSGDIHHFYREAMSDAKIEETIEAMVRHDYDAEDIGRFVLNHPNSTQIDMNEMVETRGLN